MDYSSAHIHSACYHAIYQRVSGSRSQQVTALLSAWRKQTQRERSSCRQCQHCLKQSSRHHFKGTPPLEADRHSSARSPSAATSCSSASVDTSNITAGIPVSPANTAIGHQLWQVLRDTPPHFVAQAQSQLHDVAAQPGPGTDDLQSEGVLAAARRRGLLEDILYYWALAEAYLAEASLQSSLRHALGRPGSGPLAQGNDTVTLRTKVKLLDGQDGQYMIGSVHFAKPGEAIPGVAMDAANTSESAFQPGVSSRPALDSVMASARGQALLNSQGSLPSRMSREGAARTYHMYTYWGYFNRRMAVRRHLEQKSMPGFEQQSGIAFGDNSKQQKSYYGEMTNVWRYFENVPDAISDLRTKEAAAVADRHLRALFGDQEECLTTLIAWQQMTHEAKWFGRALYDAEEIAIRTCGQHMTDL